MNRDELINYIHNTGFDTKANRGALGCLINETIANLEDNEIDIIAMHLSKIYPRDDFASGMKYVDHVAHAIALRTVFGPLYRNGLVLEYTHPDRTEGLNINVDLAKNASWAKPFVFIKMLENHFKEGNNNYGLIILYEMIGHRYGDLSVLSEGEDRNKNVLLMEQAYMNSFAKAQQIKCMKQLFSPWYWGALYFTKLEIRDKATEWHKRHQEMAMQYMVKDRRDTYLGKIALSLQMLKKLVGEKEFNNFVISIKNRNRNPCYANALSKGLKQCQKL
jgi:hypothetical protein